MANEQMRDYWATGGEGWVAQKALFDSELAAFATVILDAADPGPGDRVLDIGCGTGIVVAEAVARGATGTGVDISPVMVDGARAHVPAATFAVADAQTDDLSPGGPFTKVLSRFGVMFFDDPTAAFANIRRAAAPGADLVFVCWRAPAENPMFSMGTSVLLDRMDPPPPPVDPTAPGPSSFADRSRVAAILDAAGWEQIAIEAFDAVCDYGHAGSDGVEERLTMVLNTGGGRLAQDQLEPALGPDGWAALLDEVRTELRRHLVDGTLRFNGATWLVTARNPG
jgi:SAM-dependent methyltransferase